MSPQGKNDLHSSLWKKPPLWYVPLLLPGTARQTHLPSPPPFICPTALGFRPTNHPWPPTRCTLPAPLPLPCCSSPGMPFPHSLPSEAPAPFEAQLQCHFLQKAFPDALLVPTLLDLLPFTENPADVPLTELVAVSSLGQKLLEVTRDMILLSMMPDTQAGT